MFNNYSVENLLMSLSVKEFFNRFRFDGVAVMSLMSTFCSHTVYM